MSEQPSAEILELSPSQLVNQLAHETRRASTDLIQTTTAQINDVLSSLADALRENNDAIITANQKDIIAAKQNGASATMLDRLMLNAARIDDMATSIETIKDLPDPVGKTLWNETRPNGLRIERISVPIGVFGMIYESRPNVTIDAAALCLKSRNSVVLRGGSESLESSLALHAIIQDTLRLHGLPEACVSMIPTKDRDAVGAMLAADQYIDVIIPRGGKSLIERVMKEARMPVFGHLEGVCHIYIHPSVKPSIAREVTLNAKMRRTGICGAVETLLIDKDVEQDLARAVLGDLLDAGCEVLGDRLAQGIDSRIRAATQHDWACEYLGKKISVAIVSNVEEAVAHINGYGSHHTDCILGEDQEAVTYFQKNIDSGIVMHNASTQFADGGEFGMGAEIGIATGKLHARGPVGLEQLCTYKYLVHGDGQTRPV